MATTLVHRERQQPGVPHHDLCEMLLQYLGPEGFVTRIAATGPAGLEQLAHSPVDFVILDVPHEEASEGRTARHRRGAKKCKEM